MITEITATIDDKEFERIVKERGYVKHEPCTAELEVKPKFSRVKLTVGSPYWVMATDGNIRTYTWKNDTTDKRLWQMGNVHPTREAAELARDRQQAKVRVTDKLAELRTEELDWRNTDQQKFQPVMNVNGECSLITSTLAMCAEKELYSTQQACEWVAENMASDVKLMLTGELDDK